MATDEELIEQIREGQHDAYTELFRKHYAGIYAICLSIVKNPQDAEELAQDMFVHAYLKLGQLRDPARFLPWLKKMAHNRSRNYARRNRDKVVTLPFADSQPASADPDEELLRQELIQAIMDAIEALPVRDRQVVRARIDGLSHAEISRRFGISYRASLSRLYRVRRKLAEHLKGLYSMFGLPNVLPLKKLISGGIIAMKIGTGAKVTIGIVSVLVVALVGFHIAMQQSDHDILPLRQSIQETYAKSPVTLKSSQQTTDEKDKQTQINSITALPDNLKESITEEEEEKFLAWLDEIGNPENSEESVSEPQEERLFGLTRAEIEAKIPVLEKEIHADLTRVLSLYNEIRSTDGNGHTPEVAKWRKEAWTEALRLFQNVARLKIPLYTSYVVATGGDNPLAAGGWIYELLEPLPMRVSRTEDQ